MQAKEYAYHFERAATLSRHKSKHPKRSDSATDARKETQAHSLCVEYPDKADVVLADLLFDADLADHLHIGNTLQHLHHTVLQQRAHAVLHSLLAYLCHAGLVLDDLFHRIGAC